VRRSWLVLLVLFACSACSEPSEPDDGGEGVHFTDATAASGISHAQAANGGGCGFAPCYTGGAAVGDYDGDGAPDLFVTRFDARRKMSHEIFSSLKERYNDEICTTRISENVAVAESPAATKDVFAHSPDSRGAADYDALLHELIATGFIEDRESKVVESDD